MPRRLKDKYPLGKKPEESAAAKRNILHFCPVWNALSPRYTPDGRCHLCRNPKKRRKLIGDRIKAKYRTARRRGEEWNPEVDPWWQA